jgi:hypothetical protein
MRHAARQLRSWLIFDVRQFMSLRSALLGISALSVAGCPTIPAEQKAAHVAPLLSLEEITKAVVAYRLREDRWPLTKDEVAQGADDAKIPLRFFQFIEELTIVEHSPDSISYRCRFPSGGSSEIRVNLK